MRYSEKFEDHLKVDPRSEARQMTESFFAAA